MLVFGSVARHTSTNQFSLVFLLLVAQNERMSYLTREFLGEEMKGSQKTIGKFPTIPGKMFLLRYSIKGFLYANLPQIHPT